MHNLSLRERTIDGFKWSFLGGFGYQGLQFAVGIVLARLLAPEEFGLIGMLIFFVAISRTFVDSGFSQALIRKAECSKEDFNTAFYFNLLASIMLYLILFLCAGLIGRFFEKPELVALIRVLGLVLIINASGLIQQTILTKEINFKVQAMVTLIASLFAGVVSISMACAGFGVWSLVGRILTLQLVITLLFWVRNSWRPSLSVSMKSFRDLFGFGSKLLVSGLIETVYQNVYYVVIGKYFTAADLGYYSRADEFQRIPSENLNAIISRVSYPALATIQDETERLKSVYRRIIMTSMYIIALLMVGLASTAPHVVIVLIGEKWVPAVPYLQLLCLSGMLYPLHALNLNMLKVKGRSDLFLRLEIIKKTLAVPIILIGIFYGITWMIVGMIVHSILGYFLNSYWSGRLIGYPMAEQLWDIVPSIAVALVMGAFTYTVGLNLHVSPYWVLIIQVLFGVGLALGLSICLRLEPYRLLKGLFVEYLKK